MSELRILIVDDHPVVRKGIATALKAHSKYVVAGEAEDARSALSLMRSEQPDLALVDISLPGIDGLELIKLMRAERPELLILVLSMHEESVYAMRALKAGARGYMMKGEMLERLIFAIEQVASGEIYVSSDLNQQMVKKLVQTVDDESGMPVDQLSDRELEVFQWIGRGSSTREIADRLNLSVKTVETHRAHIKEKLGFKDANALQHFAISWMTREPALTQ